MRHRLTKEEKMARERMRLVEPKNAMKILGHHRYWSRQFFELLLDRAQSLSTVDPVGAFHLAEPLPVLAQRVPVDRDAYSFKTLTDRESRTAHAHLVRLRCAHRAGVHRYDEQDVHEIERLLRGRVHRWVAAEYLLHQAARRLASNPWEALQLNQRAVELSSFEQPILLGEILLLRGLIRQQLRNGDGLADVASSLMLCEDVVGRRSVELIHRCLRVLEYGLTRFDPRLEEVEVAIWTIGQMRRRMAHRPLSALKMRLHALRGLLASRLGVERAVVRALEKARAGLAQLGDWSELVFVSLDLTVSYLSMDREPPPGSRPGTLMREITNLGAPRNVLQLIEPWGRGRVQTGIELRLLKLRCWPILRAEPIPSSRPLALAS